MSEHPLQEQRIVVGVDGSQPSIEALREARRLGEVLGCTIDAVTSWQLHETFAPKGWDPERDAQEILTTAITEAFGDQRPEGLHARIIRGQPARVLIEESPRATMLIVGSRGRGGFPGLLLGSVSSACAAHSRCPVLVMHSPHANV